MQSNLSAVDHLAIIVKDIGYSVNYYQENFNCKIKFQDSTWAMIQFENINLALVTEDEHPNHFAIVDPSIENDKNIKFHRDGIGYIYQQDPDGNYIELLDKSS